LHISRLSSYIERKIPAIKPKIAPAIETKITINRIWVDSQLAEYINNRITLLKVKLKLNPKIRPIATAIVKFD